MQNETENSLSLSLGKKIDIQFVLREINYSFGNSIILHEIYEILLACLAAFCSHETNFLMRISLS